MDVTPMEYLARTYGGFTSPWRSVVEGWSGEDAAGVELHGSWTFDVPERFAEPRELYERLA